ncbi:hypothetical protein BD309DRAFT_606118 [Dichomitus squalens]|uniref:DUF7702 domain-containing protein n=2 Tax=Dichomitus squalens TaxID=114155 RepID=A0A4Q9N2U9_9APHY|nr:uncharacterized protein DICSQDRAFT_67014 [Dichomitus squalens LYAD-421 SS1]EJF58410.1 hypothetical protein DICSQDRAFT_67014 [Dichomitus squalens LYAD-421 SS1]TBU34874.1 hypothetical protein BD311DRAFT_681021 [Dichomitus squalens]TBU46526.1 hypothetical protein BD309DRAFT_606118 [Dichomitus squalens]
MGLDARGIIAIIEIIIYIPILCLGIFLSFRHGFARNAGWIFLVILALIRLIGGVSHILSENNPGNSTERTMYVILEAAGLAPLLSATLGFLRTVSQYSLDNTLVMTRGLAVLTLVSTIGLVLTIYGGTKMASASSEDSLNSGSDLRHAGIILFIVVWVGCALVTFYVWRQKDLILRYRRRLLNAITFTLPFLAVRVAYGVLSSFAPFPVSFQNGQEVANNGDSGLAKFSSTSSSWGAYLVMSVLMEYIAVSIYAIVGVITPLSKDQPAYDGGNVPLTSQSNYGNVEAYGVGGSRTPVYAPSYEPRYGSGK